MKYPASNSAVAALLLEQFKGLIDGISYKMGVRYSLTKEDREDLVAAAVARISSIRWQKVLRARGRQNLNNYTISVIQTAMSKEVRRIKAFGLSGLSKGPAIAAFPHEDDTPQLEQGADGLPDKLAAHQIALLASQVLTSDEQNVIALLFAFDGGPNRTEAQVARELDLSRARVAVIVEEAMAKLRRAVGR